MSDADVDRRLCFFFFDFFFLGVGGDLLRLSDFDRRGVRLLLGERAFDSDLTRDRVRLRDLDRRFGVSDRLSGLRRWDGLRFLDLDRDLDRVLGRRTRS